MLEHGSTAGCARVRTTGVGEWFRPADGGAGSLLRLQPGVPPEAVRRVRDLELPGLLPIGNVVAGQGGVWLRTPQPAGPLLADLLDADAGFGTEDAVAVAVAVLRILRDLHGRGLAHGALDTDAVLLDPDGEPIVTLVAATADERADRAAAAGLLRLLVAWCDDPGAAQLHEAANAVVADGPDAALAALPGPVPGPGPARRAAARAWSIVVPDGPHPTEMAGPAGFPRPRSGAERVQ